jgi:hypothetical protein
MSLLLLLLLLFVFQGRISAPRKAMGRTGQGILRLRWVGYYTNWAGGLAVLLCEYQYTIHSEMLYDTCYL